MTFREMLKIMTPFRLAFGKANLAGLQRILTEDFVWHLQTGYSPEDAPTGRVIHGARGMVDELMWRRANWKNVKYTRLVESPAGDRILQQFRCSGVNEYGNAFHMDAVDVYSIVDGKISKKDTYWKYF